MLLACVGYVTTPIQAEFQMSTQIPTTQTSMEWSNFGMNSWVNSHSYRREWITWLNLQHIKNIACQCEIRAVHIPVKKIKRHCIIYHGFSAASRRGIYRVLNICHPNVVADPYIIHTRRTCYFCYGHFDCKAYSRNDITYVLCWAQL